MGETPWTTGTEELYAGRKLGTYELLVPLAQGATAEVWAARTTGSHLERIVAVKAMRSADADDFDAESMFLDEARIVARIRHPNVASVLELGEDADALYIVVEWVEGEPLQILMRQAWGGGASGRTTGGVGRGVPLPLAVRIARQAASGLHAAHELCDDEGKPIGLVHRDVSPQNILIGYDGAVKVIDFGVAKATSNMQRTRIGQIKGKVPYMAPEQAIGEPVDRRSDVFALGVVLYQLVTGKHPFRADSEFATLARIRDAAPAESPSAYVPDLPAPLEEVMMKALAKARDQRFATMADFGRALERALPPPPDVDGQLGAFVGSLLSQRAAKRGQAIRDALAAVRERTGSRPRPVNLGKGLLDDVAPEEIPKEGPRLPPPPAPPPPTAQAQVAPPPPAVAHEDVDPIELPGLRTSRARVLLVGTGIVVLVVLAFLMLAADH